MIRYLHTPSLLLVAALLLAGPAHARPPERLADAGAGASGSGKLTTGSIEDAERDREEKRFEDCMATWDTGTHMTKSQWRRTCRNAFNRLPKL